MDLRWPNGASVNNGVAKDIYLGTLYELNHPSVDLINSLKNLGSLAQMYKVDISRALRQIKVDPCDIDLLGKRFQDKYFLDRLSWFINFLTVHRCWSLYHGSAWFPIII